MSDTEESEDDQYLMGDDSPSDDTNDEDDEEGDWITLSGCDKITRWQFPQNSTQCPEPTCCMEFEDRSAAIIHYDKQHSHNAILCYICDKPIPAMTPKEFETHYEKIHPNEKVPFVFESTKNRYEEQKFEEQFKKLKKSNAVDDLIRLTGCGQTSCWLFPQNITNCPNTTCNLEFGDRSAAITHYNKKHAANAIFCSLCDTPISAFSPNDVKTHYKRVHKNMEMPFSLDEKRNHSKKTKVQKDDDSEASFSANGEIHTELPMNKTNRTIKKRVDTETQDDLITLRGCGQITYWKFPPNLRHCVVKNCSKQFDTRSKAISHYKKEHSGKAIFCVGCDKPLILNPNNFTTHFLSKHQNEPKPYEFMSRMSEKAQKTHHRQPVGADHDLIALEGCGQITYWRFPMKRKCAFSPCNKTFANRSDAINHFRMNHTKNMILCFTCNKPIRSPYPSSFLAHHYAQHPNVPMPFDFGNKMKNRKVCSPQEKEINFESSNESVDEEPNDIDDVITLTAGRTTAQWKFPKDLKKCPAGNCRLKFKHRSDLISHYRKLHANHSMLCTICDKPIRVKNNRSNFKIHYLSVHPNEPIPLHTDVGKTTQTEQTQSNANDTEKRNKDKDLITLTGAGHITQWRFPKNLTRCPVSNCQKKCSTRSAAVEHYKNHHAIRAILCSICDKPVAAKTYDSFIEHYRKQHPQFDAPLDFKQSGNVNSYQTIQANVVKAQLQNEHKNDNSMATSVSDTIELNGCGHTTFWKFPKTIKKCPQSNCRMVFESRSAAINHYKELHAKDTILCSICDWPVRVNHCMKDFFGHYERKHPGIPPPYNRLIKDDLIILSGCGRKTKWQFPNNLTTCPVQRCNLSFDTRSAAVSHFKQKHASNSVHCSICDKPIRAPSPKHWDSHCEKHHPEMTLEEIYQIERCKICDKPSKCLHKHMAKKHGNMPSTEGSQTTCPLKSCSFQTTRMSELRFHWAKKHGSLKFPEIRKEKTFSSMTNRNDGHGKKRKENVRRVEQSTERMDSDSSEGLLEPVRASSSSQNGNAMSYQKEGSRLHSTKQRETTSSSSSTDDETSEDETSSFENIRKRKKLKRRKELNAGVEKKMKFVRKTTYEFEQTIKMEPVSSDSESSKLQNESEFDCIEIYPNVVIKQEEIEEPDLPTTNIVSSSSVGDKFAIDSIESSQLLRIIPNNPKDNQNNASDAKRRGSI